MRRGLLAIMCDTPSHQSVTTVLPLARGKTSADRDRLSKWTVDFHIDNARSNLHAAT